MKKLLFNLLLYLSTFNLFPMIIEKECAICLEPVENAKNRITLACHKTHTFHTECIQQWKKQKSICPLCKTNLLSKDGRWLINSELSTKNFIENEKIENENNEDILNNMFTIGFMLLTCQGFWGGAFE